MTTSVIQKYLEVLKDSLVDVSPISGPIPIEERVIKGTEHVLVFRGTYSDERGYDTQTPVAVGGFRLLDSCMRGSYNDSDIVVCTAPLNLFDLETKEGIESIVLLPEPDGTGSLVTVSNPSESACIIMDNNGIISLAYRNNSMRIFDNRSILTTTSYPNGREEAEHLPYPADEKEVYDGMKGQIDIMGCLLGPDGRKLSGLVMLAADTYRQATSISQ